MTLSEIDYTFTNPFVWMETLKGYLAVTKLSIYLVNVQVAQVALYDFDVEIRFPEKIHWLRKSMREERVCFKESSWRVVLAIAPARRGDIKNNDWHRAC